MTGLGGQPPQGTDDADSLTQLSTSTPPPPRPPCQKQSTRYHITAAANRCVKAHKCQVKPLSLPWLKPDVISERSDAKPDLQTQTAAQNRHQREPGRTAGVSVFLLLSRICAFLKWTWVMLRGKRPNKFSLKT